MTTEIPAEEALWEALGGDLCICQQPEVSHWCESCQRKLQLIREALQAARVDPSPLAQLDLAKFISEWQWNSGDGPPLFNGEYHEQKASLHRFAEALRAALLAPIPPSGVWYFGIDSVIAALATHGVVVDAGDTIRVDVVKGQVRGAAYVNGVGPYSVTIDGKWMKEEGAE